MKRLVFSWCVLAFSVVFSTLTSASSALLSADEAFNLRASAVNNQIILDWDIAKDYYLYREKIKISAAIPAQLGKIEFPQAKIKNDEFFGKVGIYRDQIRVTIPVLQSGLKSVLLNVTYQGCADMGVCYPPVTKSITLDLTKTPSPTQRALGLFSQAQTKANSWLAQLSNNSSHPLPAEQAFAFSVQVKDANTLIASWQVEDDYYLYHDKFLIDVKGADFDKIIFPAGEIKDDIAFGRVETHKGLLSVEIPLKNIKTHTLTFSAKYQGCWEGGVCYPPQESSSVVVLPQSAMIAPQIIQPTQTNKTNQLTQTRATEPLNGANTKNQTATNAPIELNQTSQIATLLQHDNMLWILLSFFGFGLLLSLTPCTFPMIPILSGIIVGHKDKVSTKKALLMSVVFVLAMSLTYAMAGVLAGYFGENLQILFQTPWILVMFSLVFVVLALSMFGYFEIQLPASIQNKIAKMSKKQDGGHLTGVAVMGFLSALIVGPCVAPPLAGALIYIGQTGDVLLGALALFVMSLGMGVPLIAIGAGASKLPKSGAWMNQVKYIFGVLMLAVAIWLLERIISETMTLILWAMLLTIAPIALGVLNSLANTTSPWMRIFKAFGLIVLGYGILIWVLVARGGGDMLMPLAGWGGSYTQTQQSKVVFERVESNQALDAVLARAESNQQIVMLDFYADWCISCKEWERTVFTDQFVVASVRNMVALKADVTQNNANDKALMARFNIIGPPAILFFKAGKELHAKRIIGEMNVRDFRAHLNLVLN